MQKKMYERKKALVKVRDSIGFMSSEEKRAFSRGFNMGWKAHKERTP